jgi:hypothetical protein
MSRMHYFRCCCITLLVLWLVMLLGWSSILVAEVTPCMDSADCQPGEACVDKGSTGAVCEKACSWPPLQLATDGTETRTDSNGVKYTIHRLTVTNWKDLPPALFEEAPDLPPCGSNNNASRSWLDVLDAGTDQELYGFCDLYSATQLMNLWFGVPTGTQPPPKVYVKLLDRRTKTVYCSKTITIQRE